ncbi:MAG: ATP-dependent DNA helicase RecG [Paracoccaceae bacterium]|nr:ATP-dependent DNA helicase RecG [Paracoccaceae bacterium]
MSTRPEILFPLFAPLETLTGVGPKMVKSLAGLDIESPRDLIFTLPTSGIDRRFRSTLNGLPLPSTVTTEVRVERHIPARVKGRPYRVEVEDAELPFNLVFFHASPSWLQRTLPVGESRIVSGKAELFDGLAQMVHPDHIVPVAKAGEIPEFEAVYPLTQGVTLKKMTKAIEGALTRAPELPEWIDPALKEREGWPDWQDAVMAAHRPNTSADLSSTAPARRRLAYDELLAHQVMLALLRAERRARSGRASVGTGKLQGAVLAALPFQPTGAQERAFRDIADDMARPERMNRLLQGDVGAGKTLVALMALLTAVEAGGQGVLMAPTEILARQHLQGLQPLAEAAGVVIELLTGRDKGAERAAKLMALKDGDIHILVGTHAVFVEDVVFKDLRLAVIDEQHRFGVAQRMMLGQKGDRTDVLVMTATPIPRSLSLAQYGDMEVSILDEKPPGRTPVTTAMVAADKMDQVVERLRAAVAEGRQAFWVCPLVDESEVSAKTAAESRFKALRAALGEGVVGLVHGQMPPKDKDAAMAAFVAGETKVLVATTVIEVGVDVPNASIMVIEGAEGFGLAQLHQLRGRVGRGAKVSTCLLLYSTPLSESGRKRLDVIRDTEDGFRIAEEDLIMRGAGDVLGTAQSGLPRFRIADLERQASLMAVAQDDARALIASDPDLRTPRGEAMRVLLWLMEQDQAIQMISVG